MRPSQHLTLTKHRNPAFYYLLNQFFVALSFWIEKPQKLAGVPECLFEFAKRPRTIYPRTFQFTLTMILPILVATNIPVEILLGRTDSNTIYAFLGLTIIFAILVRFQWLSGIRRYSSAN